jgi:hypothetical protein
MPNKKQLQLQLAAVQKRIDRLESHHLKAPHRVRDYQTRGPMQRFINRRAELLAQLDQNEPLKQT